MSSDPQETGEHGPLSADDEPNVLESEGFPYVARLELDELLEQLIARARDVQQTQGRLRGLLRASRTVAAAVDLDEVLHHILGAARTLVDARYAALGLVEQGRLVRFLHLGIDDDRVSAIGHLPEGKGLLGRLIDYPEPLRIPDVGAHVASVGYPEHHPRMRTFLGVPIRVGRRLYGNLYLTDKQHGAEFSRDDEELAIALAATAGAAISNAA
ncbi:MAG TPA: GAF domain-containing protein, partial [Micromonosporaceae bacterium]|nr:GAF domain-containing protein [Micromonosporaceae bacterium]